MNFIKVIAAHAVQKPTATAWIGTLSGWFSVETLQSALTLTQIFAALCAGLVSICAFILSVGPAIKRLKEYWAAFKAWRFAK